MFEGEVAFNYDSQTEVIKMGETILVPACIKVVSISSELQSELLEVFILKEK